jgi:aspartyl-tRNA(Asn)/glutamyl-tRNA(Gln) amidotransferase subunit C
MAKLDKETIKQLTGLCRIDCTEEEQTTLLEDLKKILNYMDQLNEIDTNNVPPCNQVIAGMANVMREDEIGPVLNREVFLANAPSHVGGMIKVPPVIKQNG